MFPGIQNIISLGVFTRRRWGDVIYVISSLKHFDDFLITKLNDFVNYKIYLYSNALLNHLSQVFSGLMTSQGITLHLFQGVWHYSLGYVSILYIYWELVLNEVDRKDWIIYLCLINHRWCVIASVEDSVVLEHSVWVHTSKKTY